jgi:hypothetical protein
MSALEITGLTKYNGPLTKCISLSDTSGVVSDGSACRMSQGLAVRIHLSCIGDLGVIIGDMEPNEAIALGALRDDLPPRCEVTTKARLEAFNGKAPPNLIARTGGTIRYRSQQPAIALLDVDTKDMPGPVARRVAGIGGHWPALVSVLPQLNRIARIVRASTSAGLFRSDTGAQIPASGGQHIYLLVQDGSDIDRFLKTLHARCWLHSFGWMMVGASGQLLERSIVDRMVGAPERLVFEAAPLLVEPLAQDQTARVPVVVDGVALDTVTACPQLSLVDQARLHDLRAMEAHRLASDAKTAREAFIAHQSQRLVERTGMPPERAARIIGKQCAGVLLPKVLLPFDDDELAGVTVRDVLADPARFEGATLADPLEGAEYGLCKAKILRRPDGTPWIHSFAHGRTIYELKLDAAAVETALGEVPASEAAEAFVRLVLSAELDAVELEQLRNLASQRAGVGKRAIERKLKDARQERARQQAQEARNRRIAERQDPRLQVDAPERDAPWLPQMEVLNHILGGQSVPEPPMRDIEGYVTIISTRRVPSMHTLTSRGANEGETDETRLPSPEEPLLTRLDEPQVAELIEQYVDYIDPTGRSVHLAAPFVTHYRQRDDNVLPLVTAVATLPIMLVDGKILSGRGLDRDRGIVFRVPDELLQLLPTREACSPSAVARAMRFLTDDWLVDVATDYAGKCVLITIALTIIQRAALPERPAFFVTAGQRGGGKTTVVNMISVAVLGRRAAAAAWSSSEEERRKALFAYLGEGVALLVWDNIPRGAVISCPSIEKALTAETYKDRILGVTEIRTVPASSIQVFTGNNVTSRGDMSSRSLTARMAVDRPDPENRVFKHADPIAWTEANRGRILSAFYTILLGNPRIRADNPEQADTRFKMWWHLVGSSIEYAADQHDLSSFPGDATWNMNCPPKRISFRAKFLEGEADEEQTSNLAIVLDVMHNTWPRGSKASDVATFAGEASEGAIEFKAALEAASGRPLPIITATTVSWRLKALKDAPVMVGDDLLVLRYEPGKQGGMFVVKPIHIHQ